MQVDVGLVGDPRIQACGSRGWCVVHVAATTVDGRAHGSHPGTRVHIEAALLPSLRDPPSRAPDCRKATGLLNKVDAAGSDDFLEAHNVRYVTAFGARPCEPIPRFDFPHAGLSHVRLGRIHQLCRPLKHAEVKNFHRQRRGERQGK